MSEEHHLGSVKTRVHGKICIKVYMLVHKGCLFQSGWNMWRLLAGRGMQDTLQKLHAHGLLGNIGQITLLVYRVFQCTLVLRTDSGMLSLPDVRHSQYCNESWEQECMWKWESIYLLGGRESKEKENGVMPSTYRK